MAAGDAIWVGAFPARIYRNDTTPGTPVDVSPGMTLTAMGELDEAEASKNWVILDYSGTIVDQRHIGIGLDGIPYVDLAGATPGTVLSIEDGLLTVTAIPA